MPPFYILFRVLLFFILVAIGLVTFILIIYWILGIEFKFGSRILYAGREEKGKFYDRKFEEEKREIKRHWKRK